MEQLYKDPSTPLRMREGPLGAYVDAFSGQMIDEGYARTSVRYALQLAADLGRWMKRRSMAAPQLTSEHLAHYLKHRSRQAHHRSGDSAILRRLQSLLISKGIAAQIPAIERTPAEHLAEEFARYLEQERRLAPPTVLNYRKHIKPFLAQRFADGEVRLDALSATDVISFVQRQAATFHPKRSKLMTTALRSFLQYARYRGLLSFDLRSAIPAVACWSMASLPKALSAGSSRSALNVCATPWVCPWLRSPPCCERPANRDPASGAAAVPSASSTTLPLFGGTNRAPAQLCSGVGADRWLAPVDVSLSARPAQCHRHEDWRGDSPGT